VLEFKSMTYGSESECATHYTTAPHGVQSPGHHTGDGHAASPNQTLLGTSCLVLGPCRSFFTITTPHTYTNTHTHINKSAAGASVHNASKHTRGSPIFDGGNPAMSVTHTMTFSRGLLLPCTCLCGPAARPGPARHTLICVTSP